MKNNKSYVDRNSGEILATITIILVAVVIYLT
jgi:hypothetical protein